jgi:hypothetical protein
VIGWNKQYSKNLFDCPQLASLTIWKFDENSLATIARATQLRSLDISTGPLTGLGGLEHLTRLEHLALDKLRKLDDLAPIDKVASPPVYGLKQLRAGTLIALRDVTASEQELTDLARQAGSALTVEILGRGRKEQTILFKR